jgi:hypothetical protein
VSTATATLTKMVKSLQDGQPIDDAELARIRDALAEAGPSLEAAVSAGIASALDELRDRPATELADLLRDALTPEALAALKAALAEPAEPA